MGGRLHPATIAVNGLGQLLPLLFVLLAGPFGVPLVLFGGAAGFAVAGINWWRFTWNIEEDALVIEQGLLQRRRRVIPLGRIQSVESVRKLRHRIFGVVALRVESIGGEDSEGRLDALDPNLAEHVRAVLLRTAAPGQPMDAMQRDLERQASGETLVHLTFGRLVVAGLTGGRVGVAAAILGFGQELWLDRVMQLDVFGTRLVDTLARSVTIVVLVVAIGLAVMFLVSVLATAITFWDFTLRHDGENVSVRRGLLEERSDSIPLRRIQAVRIEQNAIRWVFGLAAVKIEVAGRAGSANQQKQTDVVLPVGRMEEARRVANRLLQADVAGTSLDPMPTAARTRRLWRAVIVSLVAGLPAALFEPRALAALLIVVPLGALALASYRSLGWATTGEHVLARSGVFLRRLWIVPAAGVQSVRATSTPFQRRRRLASLTLEIARSGNAGDPVLIDLAESDAGELTHDVADASTGAGRRQVQERRLRLAAESTV